MNLQKYKTTDTRLLLEGSKPRTATIVRRFSFLPVEKNPNRNTAIDIKKYTAVRIITLFRS